jgi:hypothetical protein
MAEENEVVGVQPETKPDSFGSMLVKIFVEPSAVFHRVKEKTLWVTPFIILLLAFTVMGVLTAPIGYEARKEMIQQSDKYTPEQKEQIVNQMEQASGLAYLGAIAAPIVGAIFFFVGVGVLMLMANVILGGDASFKQVASISAWASMITALGLLIKTVLMLMKHSVDVRLSLAVLLPSGNMTSWPYTILNSFTDVFTIWSTVVTIIGVAIVYRFSKGRAAVAVLVPTIIFLGVGAILGKMFA